MAPAHFRYFSPDLRTPSLRRLKTAFSGHAPTNSYASSSSSTSTTSPLSVPRSSDEFSSPSSSVASDSSRFSAARIRQLLMLRHKPSVVDLELAEERRSCGSELSLLEPRPEMPMGVAMGGIFEVLEGRA